MQSPLKDNTSNRKTAVDSVISKPQLEIFYRRSTDGGASFGSTVNLSNNDGHSDLPAIAASGSNVYVVWFDNTPGNFEIFLRKSVDAGDIFGSTVNYSHSAGDSIAPTIAVSPNNF